MLFSGEGKSLASGYCLGCGVELACNSLKARTAEKTHTHAPWYSVLGTEYNKRAYRLLPHPYPVCARQATPYSSPQCCIAFHSRGCAFKRWGPGGQGARGSGVTLARPRRGSKEARSDINILDPGSCRHHRASNNSLQWRKLKYLTPMLSHAQGRDDDSKIREAHACLRGECLYSVHATRHRVHYARRRREKWKGRKASLKPCWIDQWTLFLGLRQ